MVEEIEEIVEPLSGEEIIEDLCSRLAESLEGSDCNLRGSDGYRGYSAKVKIEIWLEDVDPTHVEKELVVGVPHTAWPGHVVEVDVPTAPAKAIRERSGLAAPNFELDESAKPKSPKARWAKRRKARRKTGGGERAQELA